MSTPEIYFPAMSREQRNAVFSAVAVLAIAFLNISPLVSSLQAFNLTMALETAAIFGAMIVSVISLIRALRGQVEQSVWMLLITIIAAAAVRAALRQDLGLPFGILAAILVSIISTLTLPLNKADIALLVGYISGSLIVVFDAYAGNIYTRLATPTDIIRAAGFLAGFAFLFQILLLIFQARSIGLGSKIANAIATITLLVVLLLGAMSITIIRDTLTEEGILSTAPFALYELIETMRLATIVMGAAVTIFGSILGVIIARALSRPLNLLADTASEISRGNLSARVTLNREDEIGQLGQVFNSMADELSGMVGQLESRVADRTRDLERRALQIQTAAEIGSVAAKLRDLNPLLAQVTQLISERFGFYHTGIFLLDDRKEYAVLRAANSTGGQRMLTRGHRLKVGEVGIVGYVTGTGNPRIALDVGADATFFDNPDLPTTRSEMALPLVAGGQILGALDVQSTESNAFTQDDVNVLQVLADQVAVAIENARLFKENQSALETIRRAYGEISQAAWQRMQKLTDTLGFMSTSQGNFVRITRGNAKNHPMFEHPITSDEGLTLLVPLKVRGQNIGSVRLSKPKNSPPWSEEEINVVGTLADQVSGTLESARLYQEAQLRAATERQTASIVNQIRSSTVMDGILQNTIRELGKAFNASRTFITINVPEGNVEETGEGQS
jgi:GAF domain-containing protein/HAMP domain-containing protein